MDIWTIKYFLLSDLCNFVRSKCENVYSNKNYLATDIDHALRGFPMHLIKLVEIHVPSNEVPSITIKNELSKMHPEDIVLIDDAKVKNYVDCTKAETMRN